MQKRFAVSPREAEIHRLLALSEKAQEEANIEKELFLLFALQHFLPEDVGLKQRINILQRVQRNEDGLDITKFGYSKSATDVFLHATGASANFRLPIKTYNNLYEHQRKGVKWMWKLYSTGSGGILADDMGIGKTIQVAAFLQGIFLRKKSTKAILVMPASLISNWMRELSVWCAEAPLRVFQGKEKRTAVAEVLKNGGILISSYNMMENDAREDAILPGTQWDLQFLDEAHKIKNPRAKTTRAINNIKGTFRMALSGTPLLNNLSELFALLQWCSCGLPLGSFKEFSRRFIRPIAHGAYKEASPGAKRASANALNELRDILAPCILRRLKSQVSGNLAKIKKHDIVVWIKMGENQQNIYNLAFQSSDIDILPKVGLLRTVCSSPSLLTPDNWKALQQDHAIAEGMKLIQGAKMEFLKVLLPRIHAQGAKCLIFASEVRILDLLSQMMNEVGLPFLRMQGLTTLAKRDKIVAQFSADPNIFGLLLTSGVGSVGLNVTAANHVIIFDPAWNKLDDQAADRAYRFGQQRDVYVHRLVTIGGIEEVIYRRQLQKGTLAVTLLEEERLHQQDTHFTEEDIKSFELRNPHESMTQKVLENLGKSKFDDSIQGHVDFLLRSDFICGLTNHASLFKLNSFGVEEPEQDSLDAVNALGASSSSGSLDVLNQRLAKEEENWEGVEEDIQALSYGPFADCGPLPRADVDNIWAGRGRESYIVSPEDIDAIPPGQIGDTSILYDADEFISAAPAQHHHDGSVDVFPSLEDVSDSIVLGEDGGEYENYFGIPEEFMHTSFSMSDDISSIHGDG